MFSRCCHITLLSLLPVAAFQLPKHPLHLALWLQHYPETSSGIPSNLWQDPFYWPCPFICFTKQNCHLMQPLCTKLQPLAHPHCTVWLLFSIGMGCLFSSSMQLSTPDFLWKAVLYKLNSKKGLLESDIACSVGRCHARKWQKKPTWVGKMHKQVGGNNQPLQHSCHHLPTLNMLIVIFVSFIFPLKQCWPQKYMHPDADPHQLPIGHPTSFWGPINCLCFGWHWTKVTTKFYVPLAISISNFQKSSIRSKKGPSIGNGRKTKQ